MWEACPDFFVVNAEDGRSQVAAKFRIAGKQNDCVAFEDMEDMVSPPRRANAKTLLYPAMQI
jgi:hypothetical protein